MGNSIVFIFPRSLSWLTRMWLVIFSCFTEELTCLKRKASSWIEILWVELPSSGMKLFSQNLPLMTEVSFLSLRVLVGSKEPKLISIATKTYHLGEKTSFQSLPVNVMGHLTFWINAWVINEADATEKPCYTTGSRSSQEAHGSFSHIFYSPDPIFFTVLLLWIWEAVRSSSIQNWAQELFIFIFLTFLYPFFNFNFNLNQDSVLLFSIEMSVIHSTWRSKLL